MVISCIRFYSQISKKYRIYFFLQDLWAVINNAGVCRIGPLDWQSLEEIKKMADVNLWGLIDVTKTFLPLLKNSGGRLVNIASIGGKSNITKKEPLIATCDILYLSGVGGYIDNKGGHIHISCL